MFCLSISAAALHTVLQGFGWWFQITGIVFAVLAAAGITRALGARSQGTRSPGRRAWLPTLVASAVLVTLITVFFASRSAFLFVIPTFESFAVFGDLAQAGSLAIANQAVPADVTLGISFLLAVGAGSLAILADLLAVTWRRPALAAIPIAVLLGIPTFVGIQLADVFVFVLSAVAWLVLLRAGEPFPQTSRAVGIGAVSVVVALLVPLALPTVDESTASGDAFGGYLASVNPVLSLGDELRRELPRTILTYSTLSDQPTYLRLVSLQNFLAETWEPDPPTIDRDNTPAAVGPPPGLEADIPVENETTWVDVNNLGSPWLPVPYPATDVSGLRGNWFWDADDLTFTSPDRVARGEEYRVSSLLVQPTPAQLDVANSTLPNPDDNYLDLPADLPGIIRSTAQRVTSSATSNYGRAVALQEYFRDGTFDYSETAPADFGYDSNGMKAIAQFLEAKSGYCIHFSSAMAIMARTLGIPSRVAVGFLPGEKQAETVEGRTSYRVTTQDVHAWPELYFDGIGWTRFEPTPGRGFVPTYADEATPGVPVPPVTTPTATPTPTPEPTNSATAAPIDPNDPAANSSTAAVSLGWLWTGLSLLGVILLLLLPAFIRGIQRALRLRRLARGFPAAQTGWKEVLQSMHDLGVDISPTATPREAAAAIADSARLGETDRVGLDSLRALVERQSFSRRRAESGLAHGAVPGGADDRVSDILDRVRRAFGWRRRIVAALAPRSIWSRLSLSRAD
nr:DUF3488 and transglutaminase-like domain-containing protein [Terrimesophilobacter mesophilus]